MKLTKQIIVYMSSILLCSCTYTHLGKTTINSPTELKDAENKAMELAKEKVLLSLDEKDEILTEKVLQKSINDSIMNIDIFNTTKENIATLS